MAKKGIRRAVGANAAQWSRLWGTCEWPGGCSSLAECRNQLWNMRLVETCERHTPRRIATAATRSEARAVGCRIITVAKKAAGVPHGRDHWAALAPILLKARTFALPTPMPQGLSYVHYGKLYIRKKPPSEHDYLAGDPVPSGPGLC